MIVVLDTNVVIQALNRNHRFAIILDAWYAGRFSWAISTDILFEYRSGAFYRADSRTGGINFAVHLEVGRDVRFPYRISSSL